MTKRTIFSRPIFSLKRTLRPLTSLAATLCLASGMLIGTVPAYAAANISVKIANLGSFQCAQVLFRGQPFTNNEGPQTVTRDEVGTDKDTIRGGLTGNGMFSIDFYSTNDCSGKRGNFARFATTTDATYTCDATQQTLCTQNN